MISNLHPNLYCDYGKNRVSLFSLIIKFISQEDKRMAKDLAEKEAKAPGGGELYDQSMEEADADGWIGKTTR